MFVALLCAIARTLKQPRCPLTDEWIKKMWYRYAIEYYSDTHTILGRWVKLKSVI